MDVKNTQWHRLRALRWACVSVTWIAMCTTVGALAQSPAGDAEPETPAQGTAPVAADNEPESAPPMPADVPGSATDEPRFTGERLSLNFQDIAIRAVLQLLAETGGVNLVVSDSVQSSITLQLRDVPWDQVLDIILTTKGLGMRRNGNVIVVAPTEELAAREQAALDERLQRQQQEPLHTRYLQINYAKAADLANLILGGGQNPLISTRGSVTIDERTNTLLVQDVADRIADIQGLVSRLDKPVRQVLIESRIVIVNNDYRRDLGVRLGATVVGAAADDGLIAVTGTGAGIESLAGAAFDGIANPAAPLAGVMPPIDQRYNVNLPGRQSRRTACTGDSAAGLPAGPGTVCDTGRGQRTHCFHAPHHHGKPEAGAYRTGYGDSLPGVLVQRCYHDPVQGSRAQLVGDTADHPGRPHHHGPCGDQGFSGRLFPSL